MKKILFVSVDIVGSTDYKQRLKYSENWEEPFFYLYYEFKEKILKDTDFKFWKSIGDEITFYYQLVDEKQLVENFTKFLKNFLSEKESCHINFFELGLKSTFFVGYFNEIDTILDENITKIKGAVYSQERSLKATFNSQTIEEAQKDYKDLKEVDITPMVVYFKKLKNISEDYKLEKDVDFIGPHIDIGFRISKDSDAYLSVLSIELSEYLLKTIENHKVNLFYLGLKKYKGLNFDYPVFATKAIDFQRNHLFSQYILMNYDLLYPRITTKTAHLYLEFIKEFRKRCGDYEYIELKFD
ncbi:hypothetical protein KKF34_02145 [Myxococcota bacterium]|nr:hypothetical protein [Myxococcota bacterium]MBU1381446.1 hypothetical protein [Myxococcota bacterium]MBU1495662.1 hypothetical protein [Myxococcota bacterium]